MDEIENPVNDFYITAEVKGKREKFHVIPSLYKDEKIFQVTVLNVDTFVSKKDGTWKSEHPEVLDARSSAQLGKAIEQSGWSG